MMSTARFTLNMTHPDTRTVSRSLLTQKSLILKRECAMRGAVLPNDQVISQKGSTLPLEWLGLWRQVSAFVSSSRQ